MLRSNDELIKGIQFAEFLGNQILADLLLELNAKRLKDTLDLPHRAMTYKLTPNKKGISEVLCICGKTTKYRKPLKILDDFECHPDKNKRS